MGSCRVLSGLRRAACIAAPTNAALWVELPIDSLSGMLPPHGSPSAWEASACQCHAQCLCQSCGLWACLVYPLHPVVGRSVVLAVVAWLTTVHARRVTGSLYPSATG